MLRIHNRNDGVGMPARVGRSKAGWSGTLPQTIVQMCGDLPPVVYFMRTKDGLVKIGYTENLAQRKRSFGSGWEHILAIAPGTMDDEKALHRRFAKHLARGREYFNPHPDLIEHVNEIRERLGVSPIDS